VLHIVEPVGEPYVRLPDHVARTFRDADLVRKYRDLVDWRDAIYRRHGPKRRGAR